MRRTSAYGKYLIYCFPFIILLILKSLTVFDSNGIYILFLSYIMVLFVLNLYTDTKKNKKTEIQVNIIEEFAKGNLCQKVSIGAGTKRNLSKIEDHLTQLIKTYSQNDYNINIVKEKQKFVLSKYKEIALFFITDAAGQQIYNHLGKTLVNNGDREYFKSTKKTGKAQISDIVISKVSNKLAIVIS
ncbi:MAG: methyl-accepting chemotaxis sensory transducer, partial [Clostridia bacterium]|nr:methyl-accepting chemotaxis sensory transducer [Clostridia bacterium]